MRILSTIFKLILFIFIVVALYQEIYINGSIVMNAFYYFTIQSNILVAASLLLFIFISRDSRCKCMIRGISLLAITLTGIIYNFVLYKIFIDWGTIGYTFSRTVTHVVAPTGFILDWLLYDKHNIMRWKDVFIWLIYPVIYFLGSLYVGFRYGSYIYFFLNTSSRYSTTLKWAGILFSVLFIISFLYVGLDKYVGCKKTNVN